MIRMTQHETSVAMKGARGFNQLLGGLVLVILMGGLPKGSNQASAQEILVAKSADPTSRAVDAAWKSVPMLPSSALEKQYGIRIVLMAVTAGGGMVDFRFKILDQDKAKQLLKDPEHLPALMAENSGIILSAPRKMAGNIRLQNDAVCYLLYPNINGVVQRGTFVTAVFGDVHAEPVKAQ